MALVPIMEGKKVIGYRDEPEWIPWKGGDYDGSDGEFVPGKSHVLKRSARPDGWDWEKKDKIGRAAGKGWSGFDYYRRAKPGDENIPEV